YYTGWITKDGKVQTYLLYEMDSFYLNAKTGRLCTWNGEPLSDYTNGKEVKYTDIKGIPQEQAILTMQKYGVTVTKENKFKPNEIITQDEFNSLLNAALGGYRSYYYDVSDVEEPVDENGTNTIPLTTRTDAAVLFTQKYDNNNIAGLNGIFKTPFSDVKSSDENIGAIAIAYAKGFIPKGDGKFNGEKQITRAEAVQMIYDYLVYITE
ncbi:MAG: S-layer homology domain-containing protein, partial [Oscillospiraceae bacterium]|nr:S-layer homology domain-containing protein [Oscillospiraceae bacterium]